jgi:hypothetical protein
MAEVLFAIATIRTYIEFHARTHKEAHK